MPRKRKNTNLVKSTVMSMRDDCDWGKTLFDACYMFNLGLAEYWIDYAAKYEAGDEDYADALAKADEIDKKRDALIQKKKSFQDEIGSYSKMAAQTYKEYISKAAIGKIVSLWREKTILEDVNFFPNKYLDLVDTRNDLLRYYKSLKRKQNNALSRFRAYTEQHLFETRDMMNESNALRKHAQQHNEKMAYPISNDLVKIYEFITSEQQIEHLMGLCISIVNKYSEKEFCTTMSLEDREKVAEKIYDFFKEFHHNYDFITGCYDKSSDGLLRLKPLESLTNKFYNGYYMTIRGYVQRAYASARDEKLMMSSIEGKSELNKNHEVNEDTGSDFSCIDDVDVTGLYAKPSDEFDDGMVAFWQDCRSYLVSNVTDMADEIRMKMSARFPNLRFYNANSDGVSARMSSIVQKTIDGIDEELSEKRTVSSKLKHIVLDALGGAESKSEWKYCTEIVSNVLFKKMNEFFVLDSCSDKDEFDDNEI